MAPFPALSLHTASVTGESGAPSLPGWTEYISDCGIVVTGERGGGGGTDHMHTRACHNNEFLPDATGVRSRNRLMEQLSDQPKAMDCD